MTGAEAEDGVPPAAARTLKIIALAMGGGLTLMAGLVGWSYLNAAARVPTPNEVKSINTLTIATMAVTLAAIAASEFSWRNRLRGGSGAPGARVQSAYIVRLACREGAGLLGLTVAYIAALNGVLRVYPAYWANLAPYALFLGFLAAHWPSAEKLTAEAHDALAGTPGLSKK